MGKKRKNRLKEYCAIVILAILLVVAEKTGILEKINLNNSDIAEQGRTQIKQSNEIIPSISDNINIDESKLNILYFDVGQADCELIICDGKTMLVDAGNSKDGEKIVEGLKRLGISKIDYVIGTHVHEDHIGGMSYIVDAFNIENFYLPYNTTTTSSYYKKLLASISSKNLNINEAIVGDKIELGSAICEIMSVDNSEPENANLASIVVQLSYGELKYLFMGDAESENEKARNWNDIDVLKVGHHGSNTSSSQEFLNQVLPEIAIISVGKENSYGLPKDKILDRLENLGTEIYRTDRDGSLQIVSDGKTNEIVKINLSFDGND